MLQLLVGETGASSLQAWGSPYAATHRACTLDALAPPAAGDANDATAVPSVVVVAPSPAVQARLRSCRQQRARQQAEA